MHLVLPSLWSNNSYDYCPLWGHLLASVWRGDASYSAHFIRDDWLRVGMNAFHWVRVVGVRWRRGCPVQQCSRLTSSTQSSLFGDLNGAKFTPVLRRADSHSYHGVRHRRNICVRSFHAAWLSRGGVREMYALRQLRWAASTDAEFICLSKWNWERISAASEREIKTTTRLIRLKDGLRILTSSSI